MQSQAMSPTACYDDSLASKRAVTCRSSRISQNTSPVISKTILTRHSVVSPPSCVCSMMVVLGSLHNPQTITDGSESRGQNHGQAWPWFDGLTETGTNSDFCPPAELWERRWCPTPLVIPGYLWCVVCWNSSSCRLMFTGAYQRGA